MNVFERIGIAWRFFRNLKLKGNPGQVFAINPYQANQPLRPLDSPAAIARVIHLDPWVMLGVVAIAKNLSSAPLVAQEKRLVDGEYAWQDSESGPLVDLLAHPNDAEPLDILIWRIGMSLLTGNAYLLNDDSPGNNSLYHINPDVIRVVPADDGSLSYYQLKAGGRQKRLDPEQVIHITYPSILSEYYGQSPITALKQKINLNESYSKHIADFFTQSAIPDGLLTTNLSLGPEAKDATKAAWRTAYAGTGKYGIAVLDEGTTYQQITPPLKDLMVETLHTIPRDTTLSALGVPPVVAGVEVNNYATAREQVRLFWEQTINPIQRVICGHLTLFYQRQYGPNVRIWYDNSKISALQEDKQRLTDSSTRLFRGGIITQNEARGKVGFDAVGDGDRFVYEIEGLSIGGTDPMTGTLAFSTKGTGKENIWNEYYRRAQTDEKSLAVLVRQHWNNQLERVLDNLAEVTLPTGRGLSRTLLYQAKQDDRIIDPRQEQVYLASLVQPFIKSKVKEAGQRAINEVNASLTFDVTRPDVTFLRDAIWQRISKIDDTTYDELGDLIEQAYAEGWDYDRLSDALREKYRGWSKTRAKLVAKTETGGMLNGASLKAYEQAGVEKKEWLSAMLPSSRRTHINASGQIVGLGQPFKVGGYTLQHPGDPSGPIHETANCYCRVLAVVAEDTNQ